MDSKPLGIAALALGMIAAAGFGGYLALRPSQAPAAQVATANQDQSRSAISPAATAPAAAPASTGQASKPVAETEGTVAEDSKTPPAPASASEPVEATKPAATTSKKSAKNDPAPSKRAGSTSTVPGRTPTQVGTTANRDPYAAPGALYGPNPGTDTQANPAQAPLPQPPVEQAPPPPPPAPPKPRFEDLLIPADSVIGLRLEDTISSETARVEDRVEARVSRDLRVNGEVAIPAGTRARGNVTLVEGGGKFKERARIGVRFHTLVLADGSTIPIQTETIYRDGQEVARGATAKIGGAAAAGALIGAIFGGGKGAAIGGAAGAGAGTAAAAAGPRSQATLPAGSNLAVRLSSPATVTIEK